MSVPQEVIDLVERFERNIEQYRSPHYNETQLRREFLDPFFETLGWDVNNKQGYAQAYKDVIHEDSIRIGNKTKAPDYSFRIGGQRIFFLEAKKPSVSIKHDMAPSYQLRRYGWSAKLPISILSDFEELALYDTRVKPFPTDKASTARVAFWTYQDYLEKWDEIAPIFSREAVLRGSFDRYAFDSKRKKGTAEVDEAFLKEIESWREDLARNLALRNPNLTTKDLNFVVQKVIDRIIFLRICEARGVEDDGALLKVTEKSEVYDSLLKQFRRADDRYNSGLFHFRNEKNRSNASLDTLSPYLTVDDIVIKRILCGLYYPQCPYEFSVLPADILGQVYEQFLGKVIRLTSGHMAKVEEKPDVRKAGGVYYTPSYIVNFIVDQTLGKLLKGRAPKAVSNIRVIDPACGSGSFLIVVYQRLLDWHRDWYVADGCEKHKKRLFLGPHGEWQLSTEERKRILLNNIYGVDIDLQAVEVTKLSLALKVLEGETAETIGQNLELLANRALPDLGSNIKCGNSLINSEFYEGQGQLQFSEDVIERVNILDWEKSFPKAMAAGGFDVVVGNPPYVRGESLKEYREYFQSHYQAFHSQADLYVFFIERAVRLLRKGGRFSFIVSSSFHKTAFGKALRDWLQENANIEQIIDFGGLPVFADAKDTYVCIPVITKSSKNASKISVTKVTGTQAQALSDSIDKSSFHIPRTQLSGNGWLLERPESVELFRRIVKNGKPLQDLVGKAYFGLKTGLNNAFVVSNAVRASLVAGDSTCSPLIKPLLGGREIRRYHTKSSGRNIIVMPSGWTRTPMAQEGVDTKSERSAWNWLCTKHPTIGEHLSPFAEKARKRGDRGEFWWELRSCDYYNILENPKIIYPDITKGPRFALDLESVYISNTAYCLATDDPFYLGLLNSRLAWFLISQLSIPFGFRSGAYRYRMFFQYIGQIPVVSDSADIVREFVLARIQLFKKISEGQSGNQALTTRLEILDDQIEGSLADAYELTQIEREIVQTAGQQFSLPKQ